MKKLFVFLGICLIIIGGLIVTFGIVNGNGVNNNMIEKEYDLTESFENIEIDIDTADIEFIKSDVNKVKVTEKEKEYHKVNVIDNRLVIRSYNELKWFERIFNFNVKKSKVQIYLNKTSFDKLNINESTGDIKMPSDFNFNDVIVNLSTGDVSFNAKVTNDLSIDSSTGKVTIRNFDGRDIVINGSTGDLELINSVLTGDLVISRSTGDITLANVRANNLKGKTSTGDFTLVDVLITNHINVKASTGDIELNDSDAATLYIETTTGKVTGTLLTEKVFAVETSTGKVNVPKTQSGGLCEIHTSTGKVNIEIK